MTLFRTAKTASTAVRTPTVLQMEAVECGAAALAMILAYYRKFVPLEVLRVSCGVSRDGSKAVNIVRAARGYGLTARGLKKEPGELRPMRFPMIIFWNFNHFVVLEGFVGAMARLNDPTMGRRKVSLQEFDESFTGIALTFEPGPDFVPSGQPASIWRNLRNRTGGTVSALVYLTILGVLAAIPGLVIPTFTSIFVDKILVEGLQSWQAPLVLGMIGVGALMAALTWLQKYYLLKLEIRVALSSAAGFFWHVIWLPVGFFTQRSAGDISARVGLNDSVASILSEDLTAGLLGLFTATFFGVMMCFYDPLMAAITMAIVAANVVLLRSVSIKRRELNQKLSIDQGKVIGVTMNGLTLIESLKASGTESDFFSRWAGYQARLMNSMQAMSRTSIVLDVFPRFLGTCNTALVLGIGGARVIDGEMSIGMLVAFQALVASFSAPADALVALGGKIQGFQGDMDRLDDVLRSPSQQPSLAVAADEPSFAKLDGALELKNLTFGYSKLDGPLIEDFSLLLKPGQRIALVGASGCGKSTVAKLVAGLYEPWAGEILFDGVPRAQWHPQQLQNSIAAVDQDISLFSGTIRDNLTMWDGTIGHAVMVEAAKDACIHDAISQRSGGYDSRVSEDGGNFSGGQRQRLEIARALTSRPRLLIMDEATSALDPVTEKAIESNLRHRGCSCLMVAHRLSSIRDCDEIIVLERGKVVERGTHGTLMAREGKYAELIKSA